MMQATSVQPPKTVRIIPATIDTKAAITQNYRQLRVAAYCRVSSTVSISGSSSKELYLDFLIQFLSTLRAEGFFLCFAAQFLRRLHGHVWPLLFVVIRLVAQCDALLLQLFQPLAVDLDSAGAGLWGGVVPEDPTHVVEQPGHCQHRRGRTVFLQVVQKVLCILIALLGGLGQPICGFLLVAGNLLTSKV